MKEQIMLNHPTPRNCKLVPTTFSHKNTCELLETVQSFNKIINPLFVGAWSIDVTYESVAIHLRKVEQNNQHDYLIVNEQTVIGKISNEFRDGAYFVGYYLHKNYWNLNIMSLALGKLIDLDNKVAFIKIHQDNKGSIKTALKNGFEFVNNDAEFKIFYLMRRNYHENT